MEQILLDVTELAYLQPTAYIDKSDTVYHDHLSCHIKGMLEDAHAHTWTRKLKEHLEALNGTNTDRFPFYKRLDHRGDDHGTGTTQPTSYSRRWATCSPK